MKILLVVIFAITLDACKRVHEEPSALAIRVDEACRALARDLDAAASVYERHARTSSSLEGAELPYGATVRERILSMQRLTEQLVLCRKVPRVGAKDQFDPIETEEARGANEFVISDDPSRVAAGLRRVADGARRVSVTKLDDH